jgi:hypothetical protein
LANSFGASWARFASFIGGVSAAFRDSPRR